MIGIYKITSPSGRIYIGQSTNIEKRKSYYSSLACKNQQKLYHSLKKYGWDNHVFEVLIECSVDELVRHEDYYINLYNTIDDGLNLKEAGPHGKLSKEVRLKISLNNKGKKKRLGHKFSDKQRENMSKAQKGRIGNFLGKKHSEETKLIMSAKAKGRTNFLGKKHSEETKNKMSLLKKGIKLTDSHRQSLSIAITGNKIWEGKKHTPESIEKMRLAKIGKKASLETKAKMSESRKRYLSANGGIQTEAMAL